MPTLNGVVFCRDRRVVRLVLCLAVVVLCGCGSVDITYHDDTPLDVLEAKAGYPVNGYAWREYNPLRLRWECDIWIAPFRYIGTDKCRSALMDHEERHCDEGSFHPNTPEGSAIPECM